MTDDERYHWSAIVGINHDVPSIQAANNELDFLRCENASFRARIEVLEKVAEAVARDKYIDHVISANRAGYEKCGCFVCAALNALKEST